MNLYDLAIAKKLAGGGGGGGSSYTLLHTEEQTVSTTSTSATKVCDITINKADWLNKGFLVVAIYDKAGMRQGYFYGGVGLAINSNVVLRLTIKAQEGTINVGSATYGVYLSNIGNDGEDTILTINSRFNSINSGTIDGTYVIDVYCLDCPPNFSPFA